MKLQLELPRKKESRLKNKIKTERRDVITDTTEIQRIIRDYYEQLYANKLEVSQKKGINSQKYNPLRLNHEETENLNRPKMTKENESVIKNFPKVQDHMVSLENSTKHLKTRGAQVAQLVKRPTLAQVMISWLICLSPASGSVLTVRILEPALDSVSPSLSAPPRLTLCLTLFLKK